MKKKTIIIIIVCAFIVYFLPIGLLIGGVLMSDRYQITEFEKVKDGYVIEDKITVKELNGSYNEENKTYVITGIVKNTTDKDYSNGDLTFQVYNEEGNILGDVNVYINNFKAGKSWKIKAVYDMEDANEGSSFELINAYFYQG